jgi:DNA-binding CsgD family transcriptional regulator
MTTERLSILAAAAALGEFTASELAAYSGANPSTVRQVLQREQDRRRLFQRTERRPSRGGRPAVVWQLKDADAIFDEIAKEESRIADLQGSPARKEQQAASGSVSDRTDVYLTSAEDSVIRSYGTDDSREQEAFARIALNLLDAANPQPGIAEENSSGASWWKNDSSKYPRRPAAKALASLETVSRARIGATPPPANDSFTNAIESNFELIKRRAQRIEAFASLSARQAAALPIRHEDLARVAEAISDGSRTLPIDQTLLWVKIFVDASIKSVNAPPVAVLTTAERSPDDLFPVVDSDWRKLRAPNELADNGYVLWVEGWAESLLISNLIPGVVVSHDDSPASDEALSQVMTAPGNSVQGRAIVIASTVADFNVVARVAASGGIFYPVLQGTVEGLLSTVSHAVAEAVNIMPPGLVLNRWTADVSRRLPEVYAGALSRNIMRAISPIGVDLSDLEVTNKALTTLDSAIAAYRHLTTLQQISHSDLLSVFNDLSTGWPDPTRSREAIAAFHASIDQCKRIVQLRSDFLDSADLDVVLASRPAEDSHEAHEAFAWAYRELQDHHPREPERSRFGPKPHLTHEERAVVDLLANGKSIREIGEILAISNTTARKRVANILRKLGLNSRDQVVEWVANNNT